MLLAGLWLGSMSIGDPSESQYGGSVGLQKVSYVVSMLKLFIVLSKTIYLIQLGVVRYFLDEALSSIICTPFPARKYEPMMNLTYTSWTTFKHNQ